MNWAAEPGAARLSLLDDRKRTLVDVVVDCDAVVIAIANESTAARERIVDRAGKIRLLWEGVRFLPQR